MWQVYLFEAKPYTVGWELGFMIIMWQVQLFEAKPYTVGWNLGLTAPFYHQDPNTRIHHEAAMDLQGASCEVASDYSKRPFVFRLKLQTGSEYLFQAKDAVWPLSVLSRCLLLLHLVQLWSVKSPGLVSGVS